MKIKSVAILLFLMSIAFEVYTQNKMFDSIKLVNTTIDSIVQAENSSNEKNTVEETNTEDETNNDEYDYENDTVELATLNEKNWEKIKNDKDFIYKHNEEDTKKETKQIEFGTPKWIKALFQFLGSSTFKYILIGSLLTFLGFVIYKLFQNNTFEFRKKETVKHTTEMTEEVLLDTNWKKMLQEAEQQNDFKNAIRILYMQTLKQLHSNHKIIFEKEKTNWNYVNELTEVDQKNNFTTLTYYFDYIFYGNCTIEADSYKLIKTSFDHFLNTME